MKKKPPSTVAELVAELPEHFPMGRLKFDIGPGKEPVEVTRADLHAFINTVQLAAKALYRREPTFSPPKFRANTPTRKRAPRASSAPLAQGDQQ